MERPGGQFTRIARPSMTEQGGARRQVFGRDEEFAKRGVREVVGRRGNDDFGIAGDIEFANPRAVVPYRDSAHFDIVFRRDRDIELSGDVPVAAPKARSVSREHHRVVVRLTSRRLIRGGPYRPTADIAQVDELTVRIACGVATPSRHRQAPPYAAPSAGVRHGRDVAAV